MPASPQTQAGFSESQKQKALEIRTRLQNGENVPFTELAEFILSSEADLSANRIKAFKAEPVEKKQDVDFF